MLLCDIGNTSYHFLDRDKTFKKSVKDFDPSSVKERVFYICVEPEVKKLLTKLDNWIDISENIDMTKYYPTMGIDRVVACEAISDGVILDAGSAITVDVMKKNKFQGGFIYPGISKMRDAYKEISSALDYGFNFDLDIEKLPKNSKDAISYGFLKPLYSEVNSYNMPVVLTGGDAKTLKSIFKYAQVNEMLIFDGMRKLIETTA